MKPLYIKHTGAVPFTASDLSDVISPLDTSLEDGLTRIRRHTEIHNSVHRASVYTGSVGIKLMEHHLQPILPSYMLSDNIPKIRDILIDSIDASHCAFLTTSVGPSTVVLLRTIKHPNRLDPTLFRKAFMQVNQAVSVASQVKAESDDGCEVLYGRAGIIYALLVIRKAVAQTTEPLPFKQQINDLIADSTLKNLVSAVMHHGRYGASIYESETPNRPPLMWRWHYKRYLGAAHGIAGILHMLLLCPSKIFEPGDTTDISGTISWLVALQNTDGNWSTKAPFNGVQEPTSSIQWCHGAPGIIIMLSRAIKTTQCSIDPELRQSIIEAIRRGGEITYKRGFSRKGVGLCHGVGGSIYALLAVSDVLDRDDDHEFLYRAAHLAQLAIPYREMTSRGELRLPDRPLSMYEGVAGMCCALGEVVERLEGIKRQRIPLKRGMPGFDDL